MDRVRQHSAAEPSGDPGEEIAAQPESPYASAEPENVEGTPPTRKPRHASWEWDEGAPLSEGRTVLQSLGGGSRFEVFLVWDDRLFAVLVAKVLRPDQVEDPHALKELAREAQALERLAHPVLVRSFDAVLDGPHPHLLLEHLEGPTLRRLIKRHGPLPLQQLLPLALHVAAALHYLAAESVVHLDVKPDNIVMGMPPRLIDLSIARSLARAARITGTLGTDSYMPPEQCGTERWRGRIGPPADAWGLGATLYHAVSGQIPFPRAKGARYSDDPAVRFPQVFEDPRPLPDHVPAPLASLIMATLAKEPAQRPTIAELALGLEPLVAELPRRLTFGRRGARQSVF